MSGTEFRLAQVPVASDVPAALEALRRFHFATTGVQGVSDPIASDVVPALLAPALGSGRVSGDYPLFLFAHDSDGELAMGAGEWLAQAMQRCAPGDSDCRMAKDNLMRLQRQVLKLVEGRGGFLDAKVVFDEAARGLLAELALTDGNAQRLTDELARLEQALPKGGQLVDLGPDTEWLLVLDSCRRQFGRAHRDYRLLVEKLHGQLADRLGVENSKQAAGRTSDAVAETMGEAGNRFVNSEALAKVIGSHRGTVAMSEPRRARLALAHERIGAWLEKDAGPVLAVVCREGVSVFDPVMGDLDDVYFAAASDPCAGARDLFEQHAGDLAQVFGAVRLGRLELADAYDPAVHNAWFDAFDWQAFSPEENGQMPCIVAFDSAEALAGERMASFSGLLRSRRPLRVLVNTDPARPVGPEEDSVDSRVELGHFAVAHREACVLQSLAARPQHLLAGLQDVLASARPLLMVMGQSPSKPDVDPWLVGGAAVEGRAHPLYTFDPEHGGSWDGWFSGSDNPAPDADWPSQQVTLEGAEESLHLHFSFADFALLDATYAGHFMVVPGGLPAENLKPVAEYLGLGSEPDTRLLPFIWAANASGHWMKLIISRRLLAIARDRLRFWQTIQELSGLRSHLAENAARRARDEERQSHAQQTAELETQYEARIEEVRGSAAGDAMQGLAQMLLDVNMGDLGSLGTAPAARASALPTSASPAEESAESEIAEEPEPEEEEGFDDPWVDTPLCTSCNDCVVINPRLFVYDDNKQILIGDPNGGSFAELVKAAEACPAKCIHPGKPLDANEPNLPELIERAASIG